LGRARLEIISSPTAMTAWSQRLSSRGESIALVPTMGALHAGHLSLMRLAAQRANRVVASLFVNPLQFGPREDFARYPRDLQGDIASLAKEGVDVLFAPAAGEMYPAGFQTSIRVAGLTATLCGRSRPGHFDGVATVVGKLFNIVRPHCAVFGEKDFQQLAVIRRLVRDLDWGIEVIGHPIVREPDGLAMSSRNAYLTPAERSAALCLYHSLQLARNLVRTPRPAARPLSGEVLVGEIAALISSYAAVDIEYITLVDQHSLVEKEVIDHDTILAMAVRLGRTRLIDNGRLF